MSEPTPESRQPQVENPEQKEIREKKEALEQATERGVEEAIDGIREKFEKPRNRERLTFHDTKHTGGVVKRTELVLQAVRNAAPEMVSDETVAIGRLAASNHDTVQDWETIDNSARGGAKEFRKRFAERNEAASADGAIAYMDRVNQQRRDAGQPEVFTEEHRAVLREALDATVPGWDVAAGTVKQPKLDGESSVIARAVALADLGESGTDPEGYLEGGDRLFIEENLDVLDLVNDPKKTEGMTDEEKEAVAARLRKWTKSQVGFAEGRKKRLEEELGNLPEAAKAEIRRLYSRFDDSIREAGRLAQERESMSFDELMRDMTRFERGERYTPTPEAASAAADDEKIENLRRDIKEL